MTGSRASVVEPSDVIRPAEPYLSIVVTTRNDDHGGDPLKRLQAFVNCFDEQCRRTGLDAEVIVVEWNPPSDKPRVGALLRLPERPFCTYRFIEVPPELHEKLRYADVLPLFQMIAKNVGIRRARGRFVLATNIDIIFSTELIAYIASRRLQADCLYRVDRHDIQAEFPIDSPLEAQIAYCETQQLRVHRRRGSYPVDHNGFDVSLPQDIVDGRAVRLGEGWHVRESSGSGRLFRWATERAELILDPQPAGLSSTAAVLEFEVESNPYQKGSSIEIAVADDDRTLLRTEVNGRVCLVLPLEPFTGPWRLELRVGDQPNHRSKLPAFERRDAMHYRVYRAELRPALIDPASARMFVYPGSRWSSAFPHSRLALKYLSEGLQVSSDPRQYSYCVQFGLLRIPRRAAYRFEVSCTLLEGGMSIGVLSGDRQSWIPSSVMQYQDEKRSDARRFEIEVDLLAETRCWLLMSNDHPQGDGVSRFVIHEIRGSENPEEILTEDAGPPRRRTLLNVLTIAYAKAAQRIRRSGARNATSRIGALSILADTLARWISAGLGHRLRYRIVRASPEFQETEQALRAADGQLRELVDLSGLSDLNQFLRDRRPDNLHVNGCGDFQLMAREHWDTLGGYPEFETFSMNIDGLFSYIADAAGIREELLPMPIYHLEHEVGSGWSPEGEALLRRRIAERGITWLDASTVYIWAAYMRWLGRPMIFNGSDWGMANAQLPEHEFSAS